VRIAVSGSHSTGKSTLIAAFLTRCPGYLHEAEAFESLADDIDIPGSSEGPTAEGLQRLLEYTISTLALHRPGASVVFERSPVDYLAYAAASGRSWPRRSVEIFLETFIPQVRASLHNLELIAFVPVSPDGAQSRPGESQRFRRRVDEALRGALVDDDYGLFGEPGSPRVVELPSSPERQLAELIRLAGLSKGAAQA
jgi:hypothetical protein